MTIFFKAKIKYATILLICAIISGSIVYYFFFDSADNLVYLKKELKQISTTINKKCPTNIDNNIRLDSVKVKNNQALEFNFTLVNCNKIDIDTTTFLNNIFERVKIDTTLIPIQSLHFLDTNLINQHFNYRGKNGVIISSHEIKRTPL